MKPNKLLPTVLSSAIYVCIFFVLTACHDEDTDYYPDVKNPPKGLENYDVYIFFDWFTDNGIDARYLKNDKEFDMPYLRDPNYSRERYPFYFDVDENNIYACGAHHAGRHDDGFPLSQIKYWVNGEETTLTNGDTYAVATDFLVDGGDVYVAGYEVRWVRDAYDCTLSAKYWKNGQETFLAKDLRIFMEDICIPYSITASGGDVYVCGTSGVGDGYPPVFWDDLKIRNQRGIYWKNGEEVTLLSDSSIIPKKICATEQDIHIFSYQKPDREDYVDYLDDAFWGWYYDTYWDKIRYFKNGQEFNLSSKSGLSAYGVIPGDIILIGDDLYITAVETYGFATREVKYWKNGEEVSLMTGPHKSCIYMPSSIAAVDDDVFVLGDYFAGEQGLEHKMFIDKGLYWYNNQPVKIGYYGGCKIRVLRK